jgi:hypothetical protein
MSADRDVTRIVRSWLHEDAHEDADRLLNLVLDEIDTTPQRSATWLTWRLPIMNNRSRRLGIAAAVITAIVLGISLIPGRNFGQPSPTATSQPTPTPIGLASDDLGRSLEGGRYTGWVKGARGGFEDVALTIPAGWALGSWNAGEVSFGGEGGVTEPYLGLFSVGHVYADPCHPELGYATAGIVPMTAGELEQALTHLAGFHAGPVSTIIVNGREAKHFVISNDIDTRGASCTQGALSLFVTTQGRPPQRIVGFQPYGFATSGGTRQEIWVLPSDGANDLLLVVAEVSDGTVAAEQQAAIDAVMSSLSYSWRPQ